MLNCYLLCSAKIALNCPCGQHPTVLPDHRSHFQLRVYCRSGLNARLSIATHMSCKGGFELPRDSDPTVVSYRRDSNRPHSPACCPSGTKCNTIDTRPHVLSRVALALPCLHIPQPHCLVRTLPVASVFPSGLNAANMRRFLLCPVRSGFCTLPVVAAHSRHCLVAPSSSSCDVWCRPG